ncbi:OmpA family protein [Aliivibrio logei]|uniref:OmpA-like domain-containing protein n=1 Tax=Aliivibrio logei 5S-186 TaxID=626086 RepID=A0ABX3AUA9_ALILO|nr:OmpA family protein [Aliivibrio logei]OEF11837.1 hypothetical protein A1Q5_09850 [Aliivibrio logei 5S-186]
MKMIVLFCWIISTLSWTAHAENIVQYPQFFIGAKSGYQFADDKEQHHIGTGSAVLDFYGGVQFSKFWSWDLGYQYHHDVEENSIKVKTWLIDSGFRYDWYIQDDFNIYGRVGAAFWNMEKITFNNDFDVKGVSPLSEFGVKYQLTTNIDFSVGYQYIYGIGKSNTGKYDSHGLLIGVFYTFGRIERLEKHKNTVIEIASTSYLEKTIRVDDISPQKKSNLIDLSMGRNYLFESDSFEFIDKSNDNLMDWAVYLQHNPKYKINVIGYTDSIGTEVYNEGLSMMRAQVVANKLKTLGVNSDSILVSSKGELQPIASNNTIEGRAKNRRVRITILKSIK